MNHRPEKKVGFGHILTIRAGDPGQCFEGIAEYVLAVFGVADADLAVVGREDTFSAAGPLTS